MNKYIVLSIYMLIAFGLSAQKSVAPTPEQIARVTNTTTCVVLTGENMILEAALREAVTKNWKLTPVEFIDKATFDKTTQDANRTFLLLVSGTFKKDTGHDGYIFLNLLMGGGKSFDQLADFILLPVACQNEDYDLSIALLPAFVDIVQRHLQTVHSNPKLVKRGLDNYNSNVSLLRTRQLLLPTDGVAETIWNGGIRITSVDKLVEAATNNATDTVVGFTLYPEGGAYGYNMLIDCGTHELLYFNRRRVKANDQKGFTKSEMQLFYKKMIQK